LNLRLVLNSGSKNERICVTSITEREFCNPLELVYF
jgi:hypothetical protein